MLVGTWPSSHVHVDVRCKVPDTELGTALYPGKTHGRMTQGAARGHTLLQSHIVPRSVVTDLQQKWSGVVTWITANECKRETAVMPAYTCAPQYNFCSVKTAPKLMLLSKGYTAASFHSHMVQHGVQILALAHAYAGAPDYSRARQLVYLALGVCCLSMKPEARARRRGTLSVPCPATSSSLFKAASISSALPPAIWA